MLVIGSCLKIKTGSAKLEYVPARKTFTSEDLPPVNSLSAPMLRPLNEQGMALCRLQKLFGFTAVGYSVLQCCDLGILFH